MKKQAIIVLIVTILTQLQSCYIEVPDRSMVEDSSLVDIDVLSSVSIDTETIESNIFESVIDDNSSNDIQDPVAYAKEIYTSYLIGSGYSDIGAAVSDDGGSSFKISSCLADFNSDGVYELLIHIVKGDNSNSLTSALLGIRNGLPVILARAEQSESSGGDGLYLKKEKHSGEVVVALVGNYSVGYAQQDSCFSVISNSELYKNSVGKNVFSFDAQSIYLNSKYMPVEVNAYKQETSIYVHDGNDFWVYSINGQYVTMNDYKNMLASFDDETGDIRLVNTTYYDPVG